MCGNNKKRIILQYITKSILVLAMFNDSSLSFFSPGRRAANYREEGNVLAVFCAYVEDLLPDNVIFRFHLSSRWSLINWFWILNHLVESFDLSILLFSQSNPLLIIPKFKQFQTTVVAVVCHHDAIIIIIYKKLYGRNIIFDVVGWVIWVLLLLDYSLFSEEIDGVSI